MKDQEKIFAWSTALVGADDPEYSSSPDDARDVSMEVLEYAHKLAADRREFPRDAIATSLLEPDAEGRRLSTEEFAMFILLLLMAGYETTRYGASGGMLAGGGRPGRGRRRRGGRARGR